METKGKKKIESEFVATGSQASEVVDSTPPEEWIVEQQLAAKRAEDKMAARSTGEVLVAAKRPKVARQIAVEEAGAAESKAKPAGAEKKTRVVRLNPDLAKRLLEEELVPPVPIPDHYFACSAPDWQERLRAIYERTAAHFQKDADFIEDIRKQYLDKGYAEIIEEVGSDDEIEEDGGCDAGEGVESTAAAGGVVRRVVV